VLLTVTRNNTWTTPLALNKQTPFRSFKKILVWKLWMSSIGRNHEKKMWCNVGKTIINNFQSFFLLFYPHEWTSSNFSSRWGEKLAPLGSTGKSWWSWKAMVKDIERVNGGFLNFKPTNSSLEGTIFSEHTIHIIYTQLYLQIYTWLVSQYSKYL
jgi:hypothetical protein